MQLRDVMSHDVEIIHPEASLVEAARKMKDFDAGPVLVGDDSEIIGVITDRDIATRAVAEGRDLNATHVRDVMTRGAVYCFEDEEIDEAIRIMRQRTCPNCWWSIAIVNLKVWSRSMHSTAAASKQPIVMSPPWRPLLRHGRAGSCTGAQLRRSDSTASGSWRREGAGPAA